MSIELYKTFAREIEAHAERDMDGARRRFSALSDVFIQDSVVDIGTPFYGNSMASKGRILFDLQQLFLT